jgi:hypothetical protein
MKYEGMMGIEIRMKLQRQHEKRKDEKWKKKREEKRKTAGKLERRKHNDKY